MHSGYNPRMDIKEFFLKQKEAIRKQTREIAQSLPADKLDWRPEPEALSPGEMLRHIWMSEEGVRAVALEGNFAYYEARIPQGLRAVLGTVGTLDEELANLARTHEATLAAVEEFPLEQWEAERAHEELGFRRKVYTILYGINIHEVHHRAQLMTYLRLLGTPMPEPAFRR